ncbi:hypothetical protein ACIP3K_002903 [Enterobacter hormaechei]|uniref:hypothetical protein n=1 Tax=Enterobacter hormaechei TaxID=158836 RepID=UPI001C158E69|nr:hypothetical protein [Enterobacter hormaechei]HAV1534936.1 hypothetical protein [Enterobacter hormaechei subsp. xiangfangensis]EKK5566451.1 hypothetical protein [Enterobacter hormaechei]MCU2413450.1 hypothetical protein [Enterobacter hormaechei subsp. steigerwaltii]MCU2976026.1 hypothetical protein [Enterobacter hormaechei subsp. steigerwaltii]MCU3094089.1 hypothetical protein [Enterobacter hormaechei subsp. steigerwaltii]
MSELTKEWLKHTIAELEEERDAVPGVVNEDAAKALAAMKLALASLMADPVTTAYKLPEGWVAVPVEPTEDMIVNGFESEPDESFSDAEVWEAYDAMSGCQQAAHRAKLCWAAMVKAAPKYDANKQLS